MAYDDDIVSTIRIKASDETAEVMRGMSDRIQRTTEAFKKMAESIGGAEVVRRSFEGYAELNRTLERLQFTTKMTDAQMKSLGDTFDDVSKHTGKSTDDIAKSFQEFYELTGQKYGPALESMFKTIGEASAVTGASIESLSRIAGASVNNMKVPQEQMDILIKKLAVDLPGTLEQFATMAPRVTESLNTIGLSGAKNVEEAAVAFDTLNRAFGNTRLTASAMNDLITQLADGSSTFGKIMLPTLMEIRKNGGDVTEVFETMYQKLNAMHAFDANTPPAMLKVLGLDFNTIRAIKTLHEGLDETKRKLDESKDAAGRFGDTLSKFDHDALTAINELTGSLENLRNSFGELLKTMGANEAIRTFVDQLGSAKRIIDDINQGEWRKAGLEAVRPIGGPIPGEGDSFTPYAGSKKSANPYSTWEGNAISRPGIAMRNAWRGMFGSGNDSHEPPKMARGGVVNKPTLIEAGEAGPEAIVPLEDGGTKNLDTQDNTGATKDNTGALIRLSSLLSPTGDVSSLGANFNRGMGGGGSSGNGGGRVGGGTPSYTGGYTGGGGGGSRGGIPSDAEMDAKDKSWMGGRRGGGHGGGRHGDGGPGEDGSTSPPSGNLAAQRAGFMKELNDDPHLKAFAVDAMQHEGGVQSNLEQLFNYAAMRKMTIRQALHSGQYGPVNKGLISGNHGVSGPNQSALSKVGAGSNITDYATDQGMAGDPNFAKYMANREHYGMHKVQGAWFSAHGEQGVKWAQRQRAIDSAATANGSGSSDTQSVMSIHGHDFPMGGATASQGEGGSVFDKGAAPLSHLDQHRAMREEMERPIRMSVEAPTPPPLYSYRQRMARQQSRYQADDHLQAPRYASQMDIGFA